MHWQSNYALHSRQNYETFDILHAFLSSVIAKLSDLKNSHVFLAHPIVQEAQLSQRGRAMLCIIEYFAKSLKVSQGHSKWHCWVGRTVPEIFSIKWWCDLEIGSKGPLRSLNVALGVVQGHWKWHRLIDRVWLCKCTIFKLNDVE